MSAQLPANALPFSETGRRAVHARNDGTVQSWERRSEPNARLRAADQLPVHGLHRPKRWAGPVRPKFGTVRGGEHCAQSIRVST